MWNGTMFDDLDWPTNTSGRFISISWASCFYNLKPGPYLRGRVTG